MDILFELVFEVVFELIFEGIAKIFNISRVRKGFAYTVIKFILLLLFIGLIIFIGYLIFHLITMLKA